MYKCEGVVIVYFFDLLVAVNSTVPLIKFCAALAQQIVRLLGWICSVVRTSSPWCLAVRHALGCSLPLAAALTAVWLRMLSSRLQPRVAGAIYIVFRAAEQNAKPHIARAAAKNCIALATELNCTISSPGDQHCRGRTAALVPGIRHRATDMEEWA